MLECSGELTNNRVKWKDSLVEFSEEEYGISGIDEADLELKNVLEGLREVRPSTANACADPELDFSALLEARANLSMHKAAGEGRMVSEMITHGGFPQLLLAHINFEQLFQAQEAKRAEQAAAEQAGEQTH